MKRKILIILSNRWNRNQKAKFLELDCDPEGNILKERPLRSEPRESRFHEVWENDEGRTEFAPAIDSNANTDTAFRNPKRLTDPPEKQSLLTPS